jgi:hypothetical protein
VSLDERSDPWPSASWGAWLPLLLQFGLFYALLTVDAIRGLSLHAIALWRKTREKAIGLDAIATTH